MNNKRYHKFSLDIPGVKKIDAIILERGPQILN